MNKTIYSILLVAAVCSICTAVDYQIPLAVVAPVVDGNSLPGEWDNALSVDISYPEILASGGGSLIGTPTNSDLSANVKMLWDADNLYIMARIYDNDNVWRGNYPGRYTVQDCFQIAFNLHNNPDSELFEEGATIFDFTAGTQDGYGADAYSHGTFNVSGVDIAGKEFADGWQVEIAMPWINTFGNFAYPGDRHGFGMLLIDYDGSDTGPKNFLVDFGNGENTISDISTWNTLTLIGENGCGVQGRFPGDLTGDCHITLADFAILAQQWGMDTLSE